MGSENAPIIAFFATIAFAAFVATCASSYSAHINAEIRLTCLKAGQPASECAKLSK